MIRQWVTGGRAQGILGQVEAQVRRAGLNRRRHGSGLDGCDGQRITVDSHDQGLFVDDTQLAAGITAR